jgi:hypothetical protein
VFHVRSTSYAASHMHRHNNQVCTRGFIFKECVPYISPSEQPSQPNPQPHPLRKDPC